MVLESAVDLDDDAISEPPRGVERALARKREKYQDEVDRLTAAALAVMREQGTVDPTINQILSEAGLSTAAFYRSFPTKDDLLLVLIEQAGANTRSYLAHQLAELGDPLDRIGAWVEGMFDLLRTDELVRANRLFLLAHPRLLERFPDEINAMTDELTVPLADALRQARQDRAIGLGDPTQDARLIHHLVFGLLIDLAAQRRISAPADVAAAVALAHRAAIGRID
jgi:AcrR family transcriptional regulator